ncbi:hypothetical protein AJ79_01663 [Helicocarpus griseus UAMH5409]|uniref:Uncharacterized protein n=1 Tax=Helicocarpus griseus UAMH5409 TaxID=1447875 RepID=A0A2B7Y7H1_9EURO|nr:hypothetical protein AJ79_01663 [Helicocarpus griseus UAMH5409]
MSAPARNPDPAADDPSPSSANTTNTTTTALSDLTNAQQQQTSTSTSQAPSAPQQQSTAPSQSQSQPQPQPSSPTATSSASSPYAAFHTYPFTTDTEFRLGLGTILGKPSGVPATEGEVNADIQDAIPGSAGEAGDDNNKAELVTKAKLFYYMKKFPSPTALTPQGYKAFLAESQPQPPSQPQPSPSPSPSTTSTPQPTTSAKTEPAYPTSFADIVDLITNNQPIPGIQTIPDTVLAGQDKPSMAARRRKPWEVQAEKEAAAAAAATVEGSGRGAENEGPGGRADVGGENEQRLEQQQAQQ